MPWLVQPATPTIRQVAAVAQLQLLVQLQLKLWQASSQRSVAAYQNVKVDVSWATLRSVVCLSSPSGSPSLPPVARSSNLSQFACQSRSFVYELHAIYQHLHYLLLCTDPETPVILIGLTQFAVGSLQRHYFNCFYLQSTSNHYGNTKNNNYYLRNAEISTLDLRDTQHKCFSVDPSIQHLNCIHIL